MAIQTVKATIQVRRGLEQYFDADQMTAGEWAVSTDTKYVRMCFRPGFVLRMATYEAFEKDMEEVQSILETCQDIQAAVERFEQLAEQHKEDASESALLSESWAHGETGVRIGEDSDNSRYYSQQAKTQADRAKEEADRASSIVGFNIDENLSETSTNPVQNKVITESLKEKINNDGDASLATIAFSQATNLANIQSGDSLATAFGKLSKFCASFGDAAFCSAANNLNTTAAGSVLDARQGNVLDNKITQLNGKIPARYAGSASAGGSATSAVKLDTATAGSATQPVHFSGGKPVACTYTLAKSVPANAVFTDTWRGVVDNLASTSKTDSLTANMGRVLSASRAYMCKTGWGTRLAIEPSGTGNLPHGIVMFANHTIYGIWVAGNAGAFELSKILLHGDDYASFSINKNSGAITASWPSNIGVVYIGA